MSRPTQVPPSNTSRYLYGPFTLYGPTFQTVPVPNVFFVDGPTTPAAPWESIFLSLPAGTKMFQFPAFAPT